MIHTQTHTHAHTRTHAHTQTNKRVENTKPTHAARTRAAFTTSATGSLATGTDTNGNQEYPDAPRQRRTQPQGPAAPTALYLPTAAVSTAAGSSCTAPPKDAHNTRTKNDNRSRNQVSALSTTCRHTRPTALQETQNHGAPPTPSNNGPRHPRPPLSARDSPCPHAPLPPPPLNGRTSDTPTPPPPPRPRKTAHTASNGLSSLPCGLCHAKRGLGGPLLGRVRLERRPQRVGAQVGVAEVRDPRGAPVLRHGEQDGRAASKKRRGQRGKGDNSTQRGGVG